MNYELSSPPPLADSRSRSALPLSSALGILLLCLLMAGCATGRSAFKQGDYTEAALVSADRLAGSPNNKKAREVFLNAYPQARAEWLGIARSAEADAADPFRYERALVAYEALRNLATRASLTPFGPRDGIAIEHFVEEIEASRQLAIRARIDEGDRLMESGDLYAARRAHDFYEIASRYAGHREEIVQKMDAARAAGTLVVGVDPVISEGHGLNAAALDNRIHDVLSSSPVHFFVAFKPTDLLGEHGGPQYIEISVGDIDLSRATQEVSQRKFERELPPLREGGEPRRANAVVFSREKRMAASCPARIRIFDTRRDSWVFDETFDSRALWTAHWDVLVGDPRAVGEEELHLAEPPDPEFSAMADDLAVRVAEDVRSLLAQHFN